MKYILEKSCALEQISFDEALLIYKKAPLSTLMAVANSIRMSLHPDKIVTWQIDRNVNTTNVCVSACKFCNFHCRLADKDKAYVTTMDEYRIKIDEMLEIGGDQLLLQGGMNPQLDLEYYENLFRAIKFEYPTLKLHALGAPEVHFLAHRSGLSHMEVLTRLRDAGLESLPGAGAEILNNEVRKQISPGKCSADDWIEVMRTAQNMGMLTTATMMYGHVETLAHRVEHLMKIRDLQSETLGFRAFIPWAFQGKGTVLEKQGFLGGNNAAEYLRLIALSRIVLTNVPNIQASWLTMTVPTAQMALHGGANDMGSIMIEENVVSQAGAFNTLNIESMQRAIRDAGFEPQLRDQQYNYRPLPEV